MKQQHCVLRRKTSFFAPVLHIHVPSTWSCTVVRRVQTDQKLVACLLSPTYFFTLPTFEHTVAFRAVRGANLLVFHLYATPQLSHLTWATLRRVFSNFLKPTFLKLKFKGKGYYVFKSRRGTVTPQFGFAHRRYFYTPSFAVRFLSKTKIVLIGYARHELLQVAHTFQSYKPINVFTGRGVRFARQILYRKTGKVSLYR